MVLQEQSRINRHMDNKIQALSEKFETYVKMVHHLRFVDSSSPHYELLKRKSGLQQRAEDPNLRVKVETPSKGSPLGVGPSHHPHFDLEKRTPK